MNNEKTIRLNRSQALIKLVNANVTYVLAPRGNGKTYSIGDRIENLSELMPRSQILLLSDTYKRLQDKIVPNICDYFINHAGLIEGEDFVIYKKPPEHFIKPLIPLHNYEYVVSFADGMALCLVSGQSEGNANAFNAQAMIIDEAKFVKRENVIQASLVLRGAFEHFGHLPEYRSKWFFTDKYPDAGSNIKWLLGEKDNASDMQLINSVITLQLKIFELDHQIANAINDSSKYLIKKKKAEIEKKLNDIRKRLTFYCEGLAFENIDNLGEKYYRDQKRDLTKFEYDIAILNKDPDIVENAFYPALNSEQHYYTEMNDIDTALPLGIAFDYNWRITPMAVAQYSKLPGNDYCTFNTVAGIHTLADGGIVATCKAFAQQFQQHKNKTVYYAFDHTAVGKSTANEPFYRIVVSTLRSLGWNVVDKYIGQASMHNIRFETIKQAMLRQGEGSIHFNKLRCKYLLLSMQQAGAIISNGETKKDKSKEKRLNFPAEETTDYSEAWDCLIWAELQHKLLSSAHNSNGANTGIAIR